MSDYSWGVDGYGRQHICLNSENTVLFCVIPGCSVFDCIELLEEQENIVNRKGFIEIAGLARCHFDGKCDECQKPDNGTWASITCGKDISESNYFICGDCIDRHVEQCNEIATDPEAMLNDVVNKIDELFNAGAGV